MVSVLHIQETEKVEYLILGLFILDMWHYKARLSYELMIQKAKIYTGVLSHIRKKSKIALVIYHFYSSFLTGPLYLPFQMFTCQHSGQFLITVSGHFRSDQHQRGLLISQKSVQQPLTWPYIREAKSNEKCLHCLLPSS